MQWSAEPNGGFSPLGVQTWLPVNPNFNQGVNVADQENDPSSLLNFYKQLLHLRAGSPALKTGDYQVILQDTDEVLAFQRLSLEQRLLVVMNISEKDQTLTFDLEPGEGCLLFSNWERNDQVQLDTIRLNPYEILILEI